MWSIDCVGFVTSIFSYPIAIKEITGWSIIAIGSVRIFYDSLGSPSLESYLSV